MGVADAFTSMDLGYRRTRDMSPERMGIVRPQANSKPITRKSNVVYYLTRNGILEHPHFLEVTHLATQPLRLCDVIKRLVALRGKAMLSRYSWSCKRSYRSGYVWNDLTENDIIYSSDGHEYVLKGSELIEGSSAIVRELTSSSTQMQEPKHQGHHHCNRHGSFTQKPRNGFHKNEETERGALQDHAFLLANEEEEEEKQDKEELEEDYGVEGEKKSDTSSTTPQSLCSRGVSTEELEQINREREEKNKVAAAESAPQHSSSSVRREPTVSITATSQDGRRRATQVKSKSGRNSALLQLFGCGTGIKRVGAKKASGSVHGDVLSKKAPNITDSDRKVIKCMSDYLRPGNTSVEEKEYFSGSIVERWSGNKIEAEIALKRSNSYKEERNMKPSIEEVEEDGKLEAGKGKCIPLRNISKHGRKSKGSQSGSGDAMLSQ